MDLQTLKNNYAQEQGYTDWNDLRIEFYGDARVLRIEEFMNEICIRAQKVALEKAAENAKIEMDLQTYWYFVNKESITDPENLIL